MSFVRGLEPSGGETRDTLRRVARDGLWTVIAYVGDAGSAFIVAVVLARALSPATFGRYTYYIWILRFVPPFVALGAPLALPKVIAERVGRNEGGKARSFFLLTLRVHLLLIPLPAAVLALLLRHDGGYPLALLVVAGLAVLVLISDAEALLVGLARFRTLGTVVVVEGIAQVAVVPVGLALGLGWQGFLGLYVVVMGAALVGVAPLVARSLRPLGVQSVERQEANAFLRFGVVCALAVFIDSTLWGRPELLFLDRYRPAADLGYYSAALRLASVPAMLPVVMGRPLVPEFSRLRAIGDEEQLAALYARVCAVLAVVVAPITFIGAAVAPAGVRFLYGSHYGTAATATSILMFSSMLYAIGGTLAAAVLIGPRPRFLAEIGIVGVLANLVLDFFLIPHAGIVGAAAANVAVQLAWVVVGTVYVSRRLGLPYPVPSVLRACLLAAAGAVAALAVTHIVTGTPGLIAGTAAGLVVYVALLKITNTVDAEDLALFRLRDRSPTAVSGEPSGPGASADSVEESARLSTGVLP